LTRTGFGQNFAWMVEAVGGKAAFFRARRGLPLAVVAGLLALCSAIADGS
jgi:hypothetical protein